MLGEDISPYWGCPQHSLTQFPQPFKNLGDQPPNCLSCNLWQAIITAQDSIKLDADTEIMGGAGSWNGDNNAKVSRRRSPSVVPGGKYWIRRQQQRGL